MSKLSIKDVNANIITVQFWQEKVKAIIVLKMTSHCVCTTQTREESTIVIRNITAVMKSDLSR